MSEAPLIIRQGASFIRDVVVNGVGGLVDYFNFFYRTSVTPFNRFCDALSAFTATRQYAISVNNINVDIDNMLRYLDNIYNMIYESDFNESMGESRRLAEEFSQCYSKASEITQHYINALLLAFSLCSSCKGSPMLYVGPLVSPLASEEQGSPLKNARDLVEHLRAVGEDKLIKDIGLEAVEAMSASDVCNAAESISVDWVNSLIRNMGKKVGSIVNEILSLSEQAKLVESGREPFRDFINAVSSCPHLG